MLSQMRFQVTVLGEQQGLQRLALPVVRISEGKAGKARIAGFIDHRWVLRHHYSLPVSVLIQLKMPWVTGAACCPGTECGHQRPDFTVLPFAYWDASRLALKVADSMRP